MYFVNCNSKEEWWLSDDTFKAAGWLDVSKALESQPICSLATIPCTHQNTVAHGIANISTAGSYGHLGKYKREITFQNITVVKKVGVCGL